MSHKNCASRRLFIAISEDQNLRIWKAPRSTQKHLHFPVSIFQIVFESVGTFLTFSTCGEKRGEKGGRKEGPLLFQPPLFPPLLL